MCQNNVEFLRHSSYNLAAFDFRFLSQYPVSPLNQRVTCLPKKPLKFQRYINKKELCNTWKQEQ
jgi:hypothetical protein